MKEGLEGEDQIGLGSEEGDREKNLVRDRENSGKSHL